MIRLLMFGVVAYFTINFTLSNPDAAKRLKIEAELAAKSAAKYTIEGANKLNKVLNEDK
tara:strand:- start:326 stop:502 length:177 start_codon:yes stop_codon:yes gene_type:complete